MRTNKKNIPNAVPENAHNPAAPICSRSERGDEGLIMFYSSKGLTKREAIAAMAMQGMVAANWTDLVTAAKISVNAADELLRQLENKKLK